MEKTKLEDSMQPPLKAPFPKPSNRERFWNEFQNKQFTYVAKKYGNYGLLNTLKTKLRNVKRRIISKVGG